MLYLDEVLLDPRFNVSASPLKPYGYAPATPKNFHEYLKALENVMFVKGWTVIGSIYKSPKLHPWKDPTRDQLHEWAQHNLSTGAANSLNIRLADTDTIALDCDFHYPYLMQAFVDLLRDYLLLRYSQIYTCAGKKGGKIFFRYYKSSPEERLPVRLGITAYNVYHGNEDDYKQELEIKSNVSTVAGLYGKVAGREVVYGPYAYYPYICEVRPTGLPELTAEQLLGISWRYINLLYSFGMVDNNNCRILPSPQHLRTEEALCSVVFLRHLLDYEHGDGQLESILRSIEQGANYDMLLAWLNFAGQCQAHRILCSLYVESEAPEQALWQGFKQQLLSLTPNSAWNLILSSSNRLFTLLQPEVQSLRFRLASIYGSVETLENLKWVWSYVPLQVLALSSTVQATVPERLHIFAQAVQHPHYRV